MKKSCFLPSDLLDWLWKDLIDNSAMLLSSSGSSQNTFCAVSCLYVMSHEIPFVEQKTQEKTTQST